MYTPIARRCTLEIDFNAETKTARSFGSSDHGYLCLAFKLNGILWLSYQYNASIQTAVSIDCDGE